MGEFYARRSRKKNESRNYKIGLWAGSKKSELQIRSEKVRIIRGHAWMIMTEEVFIGKYMVRGLYLKR
jgi:hypothetical protein